MVQSDPSRAAQVYVLVTSITCVLLALPGVVFAVAAGVLFGPFLGSLLCLIATTIGAAMAFLAGRYFMQDAVRPWVEGNRHLKRFLFEDIDRSGFVLLMVTRLIPLFPYNLQNFAYGLTDIKLLPYTFYTFIFMAPGVTFFTFGAAGLGDPANRRHYLAFAGLLALGVVGVGLWLYRRFVKEVEE
ncbi:MAG: TVP38/TMEM64 family protein [Fretibacterium sp.]|nr:TVP38/TMEM64 family protein [Fretibacterium sp.]